MTGHRKDIGALVLAGTFGAAFFVKGIDFNDFANAMMIVFGVWVGGNVGEHFAKR